VEFVMGSPPNQHRKRIGRTFAIAAKPVTVKQYLQFRKAHVLLKERAPTEDCPVHGTSWYEAAQYCNWLSEQERIPKEEWCYETNPNGQVMKLKEKYLSLTGYRLPTEAEMEYATRAGAVTNRYYGVTEELLGKYGWFLLNSRDRSWPVGSKKPNDQGLFDLHGNVRCWCQESFKDYSKPTDEVIEDKEDVLDIDSTANRVLRGGSFVNPASHVRSSYRLFNLPSFNIVYVGFRAARTFTH